MNSEVHVISEDSLIIPKAHHDVDEGWYECLVETPHHNISALFTVIVDKGNFFYRKHVFEKSHLNLQPKTSNFSYKLL